jgi:methyl-accepting chemotaxis protein
MFKKTDSKTIKYEGSEYIHKYVHKDILIKVICDLIQGKATKLTYGDTRCNDLVDKWNEMINTLCESRRKTNLEINQVLQMITKEVFENSSEAKQVTKVGVNSIKFVKNSFDDIDKQMQEVREKIDRISEIADIIKCITNETNLIALNTAIEASRAGEQVRSFVVSADELRKLSEHTKNSILDIEKNIYELQGNIDLSVQKINATVHQLDSSGELADNALNLVHMKERR